MRSAETGWAGTRGVCARGGTGEVHTCPPQRQQQDQPWPREEVAALESTWPRRGSRTGTGRQQTHRSSHSCCLVQPWTWLATCSPDDLAPASLGPAETSSEYPQSPDPDWATRSCYWSTVTITKNSVQSLEPNRPPATAGSPQCPGVRLPSRTHCALTGHVAQGRLGVRDTCGPGTEGTEPPLPSPPRAAAREVGRSGAVSGATGTQCHLGALALHERSR